MTIGKDATASGIQNGGIEYGYQINKLNIINLNSPDDDYCDTYQYLIDEFLNIKEEFSKYKKRKF
jgi:hypothetical protein